MRLRTPACEAQRFEGKNWEHAGHNIEDHPA